MAIEILTVGLDDATMEEIARRVAKRLASGTPGTGPDNGSYGQQPDQGNQGADPRQGPDDGWSSAPPQQGPPQGNQGHQGQSQGGYQQQQGQQQGGPAGVPPACAHGEMKPVPGGYSKSTNKPYNAFWSCPAPRGPGQCKPVWPN